MAVTINSVDCRFSSSSMSSVWGDWKSSHINALFLIIQHIKLWSELSWEGEQRIVHVKHMWVGAGKGDHFPFPPWVCYCIRRMHSTGKAVLGTVLSGWPWFRRPLSFFSPLSFTALQGEGQKIRGKMACCHVAVCSNTTCTKTPVKHLTACSDLSSLSPLLGSG